MASTTTTPRRRWPTPSRRTYIEEKKDDDIMKSLCRLSSPTVPQQLDDDTDNTQRDSITQQPQQQQPKTSRRVRMVLLTTLLLLLLQTLLLDVPLFMVLLLRIACEMASTTLRPHLVHQYQLMQWSSHKAATAGTYYHRHCDEHDLSAHHPQELVVPTHASTEQRVQHMLQHGVSVYPDLLTPGTANRVRNFILQQNLKNEDMIGVIENSQRWSFFMKVDQDAAVTDALSELLGQPRLRHALEALMGPDPAVIEFTGITSAYGAKQQRWHQDVVPDTGSATKYARSFVPSYSLFVPLQNITSAMGATGLCPGTHMCSANMNVFCAKHGWPVSGTRPVHGVDNWPLGYGALLNQQTSHAGMAHTDPHGPPRVLFIITFAPRPQTTAHTVETRYIATGGSYSLHWSHWGHTFSDFANARTHMTKLPRLLRTLGLYVPPGRQYGWDFWTSAIGQMTNEDGNYVRDSLDTFVQAGGFAWLPLWLHGTYNDDNAAGSVWMEYYSSTLDNIQVWARRLHAGVVAVYAAVMVLVVLVMMMRAWWWGTRGRRPSSSSSSSSSHDVMMAGPRGGGGGATWVGRATIRVLVMHVLCWGGCYLWQWHVERSGWAHNLASERAFQWPHTPRGPALPSVLPLEQDVLVLDDFQSDYLASFDRVLDYAHPGNVAWRQEMEAVAVGYQHLPDARWQRHMCGAMLRAAHRHQQRRMLIKNVANEWAVADASTQARTCHKQMLLTAWDTVRGRRNGHVRAYLIRSVDHLLAETKFGYWRDTSLMLVHIPERLLLLQDRLLHWTSPARAPVGRLLVGANVSATSRGRHYGRPWFLSPTSTVPRTTRPTVMLRSSFGLSIGSSDGENNVEEPFPGAWAQVGDMVEAIYTSRGYPEWYAGRIDDASADTMTWAIDYEDGEYDASVCRTCIRPFVPYAMNEAVDFRDDDEDGATYRPAVVVAQHFNNVHAGGSANSWDIRLVDTGRVRSRVPASLLRRSEPVNVILTANMRVEAAFEGGDEWFPGVITKVHDAGDNDALLFDVLYDDHDFDEALPRRFVRPLQ